MGLWSRSLRRGVALGLVVTLASVAGCATRSTAPVIVGDPPPEATSPVGAVQRLHWAFDHGDADVVAGLLTTDFVFGAVVTEADGFLRHQAHDRATTLLALRAMFEGVPGESTPASVSLGIDRELVAHDDPRPGRSPIHHQIIFTPSTLRLEDSRVGARVIIGGLGFVLARGDAAAIPPGQPAIASQWWIEQIEEAVLVEVGTPGTAARPMTWGDLFALYLERAAKTTPVGDILTSR